MPHIQRTFGAEASADDCASNPFLLPAFDYVPKLNFQAECPSLVIPLLEDHPNEFVTPSYIDPSCIHDLSQTIVWDQSASYYSLDDSGQGQILSPYQGSSELSTLSFFDSYETIPFNLGYSEFDKPHESVGRDFPNPDPKAPVSRPQSHGESSPSSENLFSNAVPLGFKRDSDTECKSTRLPKKFMFMHPNSGLDNSKITDSGLAPTEDIQNNTNIPCTDKLSHSPDSGSSTAKGNRDDCCHTPSKLDEEGDATFVIRELSKSRSVNSKTIRKTNRRKRKAPDNGFSDKASTRVSR